MWSFFIVFLLIVIYYFLRFFNGWKNICIQDIFPESSVQPFYTTVLLWFSRLYLLPFYGLTLQPKLKKFTSEFRAIIGAYPCRFTIYFNGIFKVLHNHAGRHTECNFGCNKKSAIMVFNIQDPDSTTICQCIAHEIHSPFLICIQANGQWIGWSLNFSGSRSLVKIESGSDVNPADPKGTYFRMLLLHQCYYFFTPLFAPGQYFFNGLLHRCIFFRCFFL